LPRGQIADAGRQGLGSSRHRGGPEPAESLSGRSPALSATLGRPQRRPSTASRFAPWSSVARKSWTACSLGASPMPGYSV